MRQFSIIVTIFLTLCFAQNSFAQCESEGCGLVISGKVTNLEVDRSDKTFVRFKVNLDVRFSNLGTEPIILFKPEFGDGYWLGGWSLYQSEEDAKNFKAIFGDGYWQSVAGGERYRKLAEKLDVKTPPNDFTKILKPKDSWEFTSDFQISFEAEKHYRYPELKTWKEMQEFPTKLWLKTRYELSPWNVEYFKPNLIRNLQDRWKAFGNVLVSKEKEDRFNLFRYASEPMLIDFSQATQKQNN